MITVGLTGGIASGKSTVSSMFRESGIPVICADELAHEAVSPGSPALEKIMEVFGSDVLDPEGNLNRAVLGSKVFTDSNLKKRLEQIIHPVVARRKEELLRDYERQGHRIVVVDVPLLFEANWENTVDVVLVVYVNRDVQGERLMRRNGLSVEEVSARLNSQWPIEDKRKKAHIVIDNSLSIEDTRTRFRQVLAELIEREAFLGSPKNDNEIR